jgi:hypothetical protein
VCALEGDYLKCYWVFDDGREIGHWDSAIPGGREKSARTTSKYLVNRNISNAGVSHVEGWTRGRTLILLEPIERFPRFHKKGDHNNCEAVCGRCSEIICNVPWATRYDETVEHERQRRCFSIFEKNWNEYVGREVIAEHSKIIYLTDAKRLPMRPLRKLEMISKN